MAIFFNHIKGCGVDSTGQSTSTRDLWTWIKFATIAEGANNADLADTKKSADYLPSIIIGTRNDAEATKYDLGKIITSYATGQTMDVDFTFEKITHFNNQLEVNSSFILTGNESAVKASIVGRDNKYHLAFINGSRLWFFQEKKDSDPNWKLEWKPGEVPLKWDDFGAIYKDDKGYLVIESSAKGSDGVNYTRQNIYIGVDQLKIVNHSEKSDATLEVSGKCEALYFNATSDVRAKDNITPSQFSALAIVNSLPIYSFNYISQPEIKTIGLIAQEAAKYNLDGFNLVDNLNATGHNDDMMQMKESKLVYVLWKAIQELSAEVEELKAEIRNLK